MFRTFCRFSFCFFFLLLFYLSVYSWRSFQFFLCLFTFFFVCHRLLFFDAYSHPNQRVCPSVRPYIRVSVLHHLVKTAENSEMSQDRHCDHVLNHYGRILLPTRARLSLFLFTIFPFFSLFLPLSSIQSLFSL